MLPRFHELTLSRCHVSTLSHFHASRVHAIPPLLVHACTLSRLRALPVANVHDPNNVYAGLLPSMYPELGAPRIYSTPPNP